MFTSKIAKSYSEHKLFCKVCHDAGLDFEEYTSHKVKDKNVVICPTLLSQKCLVCNKNGHTTKYCPTVLHSQKEEERQTRIVEFKLSEEKKKKMNTGKSTAVVGGGYAVLAEKQKKKKVKSQVLHVIDVKDVQEEKKVKEELFPYLSSSTINRSPIVENLKITYSAALKSEKTMIASLSKHSTSGIQQKIKINWADIMDSDDEN
jgi:hypothetical protein